MKKKSIAKKTGIAATAVLFGALAVAATNSKDKLQEGVLVAKGETSVKVRDCATDKILVLNYGNEESQQYLVGESVGFVYNYDKNDGVLIAHYPDQQGCGFYHS